MPSTDPLHVYLSEIEQNLQRGDATEHTHRSALKKLIEALAPGVIATNEPKRKAFGAPVYIVTRGQTPLGYIEAKDVSIHLDHIEKDEQLKRYHNSVSTS